MNIKIAFQHHLLVRCCTKIYICVVSYYAYLGITMNYNNKYGKAIRKQLDQGRKAQFSLLGKAKKLELPIDIQCNLFEKTCISDYAIMVVKYWEIFYRKCVQKISNLRPSTPSCMVYGEYDKLPVKVPIDKRLVSFWRRLLNKEDSSLAHIVYMISHNLFVRDVYKAMWICRAKHIVDNCGLSYTAEPTHDGY